VACTIDTCEPGGQCFHDDVRCYCSTNPTCTDLNPCTDDFCEDGVCQHSNRADYSPCDDGNPCTDEYCYAGDCEATVNTASCDDHNACTLGDTCHFGDCWGTPKDCDDDNPNTIDGCFNGQCEHCSSPCWEIPGDYNCDAIVDGCDYEVSAMMCSSGGPGVPRDCCGFSDYDGDGDSDLGDFARFQQTVTAQ